MEQTKYRNLGDWAGRLWLFAAFLLGVALALALGANRRQTLFYVVLLVGVVAVTLLNQKKKPAPVSPPQAQTTSPDLVQQLLQGNTLTAADARSWLDQLLVEQQEEEQK
jgi:hypothetical protein